MRKAVLETPAILFETEVRRVLCRDMGLQEKCKRNKCTNLDILRTVDYSKEGRMWYMLDLS